MQALQRSSVASKAQATSAVLTPVRPAVAMRLAFKAGQPQPLAGPSPRTVATSAAAVLGEPLVLGMDKSAQKDLVNKLPKGYHWYETMMILRPTMNEEERDRELAKFEAFLNKEECQNINALVRGTSRLAYNMRTNWEGIYVVYTYSARRQTAQAVQKLLSTPEVGSEDNVLRHITFCKY